MKSGKFRTRNRKFYRGHPEKISWQAEFRVCALLPVHHGGSRPRIRAREEPGGNETPRVRAWARRVGSDGQIGMFNHDRRSSTACFRVSAHLALFVLKTEDQNTIQRLQLGKKTSSLSIQQERNRRRLRAGVLTPKRRKNVSKPNWVLASPSFKAQRAWSVTLPVVSSQKAVKLKTSSSAMVVVVAVDGRKVLSS